MDSILTSTKKLCGGIAKDVTSFDDELILFINSIFFDLYQMGIGPKKVFRIADANTLWEEFVPEDDPLHEICKTYVGSKTRLRFDPPANSNVMQALKDTINECEWRMYIDAETRKS